jgi:hypothetical protein
MFQMAGISLEGVPNTEGLLERLEERPAVRRVLDVPIPQEELDDVSEEFGKSIVC